MKTLKQLALLPLFLGLVLTTACTENYDNGNGTDNGYYNGDRLLPARMFIDDAYEPFIEFFYDDQNRITKMIGLFSSDEDGYIPNGEVLVERANIITEVFDITHNTNGTIASIRATNDRNRERLTTFSHSGNSITAITWDDFTDTVHFEVNSRGQITRIWGVYSWDGSNWERTYTYNANGNVIRIVNVSVWTEGVSSNTTYFEHSTAVRAIFRNTNTPEWFHQFFWNGDSFIFPKHGFMPTRVSWSHSGSTLTHTVENGWVQTITVRDEDEDDDWEQILRFEYVNAR